jgi:hypothetical protein
LNLSACWGGAEVLASFQNRDFHLVQFGQQCGYDRRLSKTDLPYPSWAKLFATVVMVTKLDRRARSSKNKYPAGARQCSVIDG